MGVERKAGASGGARHQLVQGAEGCGNPAVVAVMDGPGGDAVGPNAASRGDGRARAGRSVSAQSKNNGLKAGRGNGKARAAAKPASRPNKRQMVAFLDALAESSNITASARAAGLPSNSFYRERRRNADFADQWHDALCEGFVRLEAELLADALVQPSALVKDATLKARAQKYRLGLALLAAHRAAVRGTGRGGNHGVRRRDGAADGGAVDIGASGQARARLAEKLRNVQARARVGGADGGAGGGMDGAVDSDKDLPCGAAGGDAALVHLADGLDEGAVGVGSGLVGAADDDAAVLGGLGWDDAL